ncbi:MAG: outer membrane beta-barrel protein [Fidelibacterota bacterium]
MKTFRNMISLFIVFLLVQGRGFSQDATKQGQTKWGIGIALVGGGIGSLLELFAFDDGIAGPAIFIPIDLSPRFRLEPEIGLLTSSSSDDGYSSSSTALSLGLGLLPMSRAGNVNVYYGGRLGITRSSSSYEYDGDSEKDSESAFFVAAVGGGEYLLANRFTLGGEAQLRRFSLGGDTESATISTRGLLFVRFYF